MRSSFHRSRSNLVACLLVLSHIFSLLHCSSTNVLRLIGAINQTISIPCPVYNINDTIDLILWFKGNQESALYSLDARSTPIERAKQNPIDESFSKRAYIDVSRKPSALIINNIQREDAGLYKCRIDFRKNRTQYRSIRLNVIDGPKEVTILDSDGTILRDVIGPLNEGGHLILICETEATDPPVNLYWYRDDELIDTSFEETEQRVIRNELTILRLTRDHLLNRFACKATNSNLTISKSATVILELNLRPLKVRIIGPTHPINSGDKVTLICESEGARPNATISWWTRKENYEDNNIENHGRKRVNKLDSWISSTLISSDFSSKLILYVNETYNRKQIICRADHPILSDSSIEDVFTLNVYYPPKVTISLGSSSSRELIHENNNVTLFCHVNSNPAPTSIFWFFNDEPISKSNFRYHENGTELLIETVGADHNGVNFTCLAISESGSGSSEPVNLKVLYSPICSTEQTVFGVSTIEQIQVECRVKSMPPSHTFYWTLNSSSFARPMSLHSFHNQIKGQMSISTLNYSAKTHLGYGSLHCYGMNSVGKQKEPCTFIVKAGSIPEKLNDCTVEDQSFSSLSIRCREGSDGGLSQKFFIEVYRSGTGKLVKKMNFTSPVFQVDGLPRGMTFVLILYAANVKGKSDTIQLIANSLPLPNKELIIITPLIACLLGVMSCLVCTAICIVVISKGKHSDKQTTKAKYSKPIADSFAREPEPTEDDTVSNLSDLVFNNPELDLKLNSTNNNFHNMASNGFYTTLELAKDVKSTNYKPENVPSLTGSKRYIMITNQKASIHQAMNDSPLNQATVPTTDQSPINFLLFQN